MKLRAWARQSGISYRTALRWFHAGTLPAEARQLPSGTILVAPEAEESAGLSGEVALYARVSSSDQKADLEAQLGRLSAYAARHRLRVDHAISEVGSGLNGKRPKLLKLLANPKVGTILVEHRDRLMHFGLQYVESAMRAQGRKLIVVESGEVKDDLVQDMIDVLTSFCARLYGRRSARNKAQKAVAMLQTS